MADRLRNSVSIFSPLGWLIGALSILNLIDELDLVVLVGRLKKWVAAYSELVHMIGSILFGWIKVYWMSISKIELHVIVISLVILSAYARAIYSCKASNATDRWEAIVEAILECIFIFLFVILVPALIFPGAFGFAGVFVGLLFAVGIIHERENDPEMPSWKTILRELFASISIALLLVALNHNLL